MGDAIAGGLMAAAESERFTVPLGFTRPVPCTSPPLARMVPDLVVRVVVRTAGASPE